MEGLKSIIARGATPGDKSQTKTQPWTCRRVELIEPRRGSYVLWKCVYTVIGSHSGSWRTTLSFEIFQ